jgi:hypothetical protein
MTFCSLFSCQDVWITFAVIFYCFISRQNFFFGTELFKLTELFNQNVNVSNFLEETVFHVDASCKIDKRNDSLNESVVTVRFYKCRPHDTVENSPSAEINNQQRLMLSYLVIKWSTNMQNLWPFFFFFNAIPVFCHTAFTVPFRSAIFPFSNSILPILSGALSPATHGHSTSHSQTYTTLIHPWAPFPDETRTRADLAVVAERVLILPSTTLPSAPTRHTQTSMARRSFLPSKKSSPFGGIRTH